MAVNLEVLKKKLSSLQTETKTSSFNQYRLKLEAGKKYTLRIVPYKYNKDNPFIEQYFHYNIGKNKVLVSPVTHGEADPFVVFAEKLKQENSKDAYILAKKLEPKLSTSVPVVVRGEEQNGIKFWTLNNTIYERILTHITDPDFGDITDIKNGRDITVDVIPPAKGKKYPTYNIIVKPVVSVLSTDKNVIDRLLNEQPNVLELNKPKTFVELKQILEEYLDVYKSDGEGKKEEEVSSEAESTDTEQVTQDPDETNVIQKQVDDLPWETGGEKKESKLGDVHYTKTQPKEKKEEAPKTSAPKNEKEVLQDLGKSFDDLFS